MGEIVSIDAIAELGERLRAEHRRIVFTNGHFDLLHVGHLRYLREAHDLGDVLVVGVNDDATVTRRKGPGRPIIPAAERAELLAGLACVDYVTIFHDLTAGPTIEALRPDVYVKGGDYTIDPDPSNGKQPLLEASLVQAYGGEVRILPLLPGHSTSWIEHQIIERSRRNNEDR